MNAKFKTTTIAIGFISQEEQRFRNMTKDDIKLGNTIFFYNENDDIFEPQVIDEVINPEYQFKQFSSNGCRTDIEGYYVIKSDYL